MNEYYRSRVSLPREVRNAKTLPAALAAWRDKRLLHVVNACRGIDDPYRENFGRIHGEYATEVDNILAHAGKERELCAVLLKKMKERFRVGSLALMPGWLSGAAGLCGTELEKILEMEL